MSTRANEQALHFQHLMEAHKGILFKVARAYCPDETDRQDLIQEIMLQVWLALPRYDAQFKLSTWLYRIALNVAISFYRKSRVLASKRAPLTGQALLMAETGRSDEDEQLAQLERFIAELNELDKALMLLYLDEKPQAEIAQILGLSVSNVATKVSRIKARLKQKFNLQNA